jgi:hypothetical protein
MAEASRTDRVAQGTRGQLSGKAAKTGKGRGKGEVQARGFWRGKNTPPEKSLERQGIDKNLAIVRIPTKPARHSNMNPATRSETKPAMVPI